MKPTDNPDKNYTGATYTPSTATPSVGIVGSSSSFPRLVVEPSTDSHSLDSSPTTMKPVVAADQPPTPTVSLPSSANRSFTTTPHSQRFSVFHLNRSALLITIAVVSFIALVGLGSIIFTKASSTTSKSSTSTNSSNTSPTNQYAVGSLPLTNLSPTTTQLSLGTATQLAINGQLLVNSTLVLNPTTTPSTPTAGQLYYDKTTNQPYFYNGSKFISLSPIQSTTTPTTTTSPTTTATTSPQTTAPATTTTTATVTSLGAATGDITLGSGLSMTANQLDVSTTFIQSQLTTLNASNLTTGTVANARLSPTVTVQGNSFNGISQLVQLTAGGILPVLSGTNLTSLNASNITTGTLADARLSTNVALLNGTGPQTFTGNNTFTGVVSSPAYTSTVITGTAPFTVASTTKVTNLNADLLDGLDSTAFGDATAANQTTILGRIGTNLDAAGTSTLFARLNNIDTNQGNLADAASTTGSVLSRLASLFSLVGTTGDAASPTGTIFARFAQLFTSIGTPTDAASASGSLFAEVKDVKANLSPVKSVQRGYAAGAGSITITSVNPAKAVVSSFSASSAGTVAATGTLSGSASLSANVTLEGSNGVNNYGGWAPPGSTFNTSGTSGITAWSKSESISGSVSGLSGSLSGGSTNLTVAEYGAYLTNSTTLTATGPCYWQIVEYN